jgi:hypothetical protein
MGLLDVKLSEKFEVDTIPETPVAVVETLTPDESDVEKARNTLSGLIDSGESAISEILRIADSTETPRAYEVAGQLIKTVADVAKDLVAIQKKTQVAEKPTGKQTNIFVGSTKELLQLLKNPPAEENIG